MKKPVYLGTHTMGVTIDPTKSDVPLNFKENISDYNIQEIRGWTIDKLNEIEGKIDHLIVIFFKPEKEFEFRRIILNSSIISSGAKLKIIKNLPDFDSKFISKVQRILSIRNAFAHIPMTKKATITISMVDGKPEMQLGEVITQLEVMNSSGELKRSNVKDLVDEFDKLFNEVENILNDRISNQNSS